MSAYASALHNVTLAGPTLFGPVIKMAATAATDSVSRDNSKYYVLLIITVRTDKILYIYTYTYTKKWN